MVIWRDRAPWKLLLGLYGVIYQSAVDCVRSYINDSGSGAWVKSGNIS